ncbi:hypothetical protein QWY85_12735 [Neolewinella lacunae]|uniref:Lipoprotein n=1 Tax=Neolewinella lacunae TaxID=1517758 RepID=A0A923T7K0_9BACT|nr:hypothetical protein [Neolewinella lacunae]MBC6993626.1 hypothetical protein [Neolewinella lacunae]MDN3635532.1 hypothetical protein [Neolewinella lacunae]
MSRSSCLLLLGLLLGACATDDPPPGAGVYYWKANWAFTAADRTLAQRVGFERLYLRLFDLDWDPGSQSTQPRGPVELPADLVNVAELELTPVVFIVNRVFTYDPDPVALAAKTAAGIQKFSAAHPELARATEWQIDCDWTPSTRDAYFSFLRELQKQRPGLHLSVTVRLHQYREREENGIPPVASGLLMCYNFLPVGDPHSANAIFDLALLRGYLKAPPYPLPLDAALPLFEWGAAFRNEELVGLVDAPVGTENYLLPTAPGRYLLRRDTTLAGTFLRAGDALRYDGPQDHATLLEATALLRQKAEIRSLLFFDWQPELIEKYRVPELISTFAATEK